MKGIIQNRYGGPEVLEMKEIPLPKIKGNEILVKIHNAAVSRADSMMRSGIPRYARLFTGLAGPKVKTPGTGFAGVVKAIGKDVKKYKEGDRIFGEILFGSGSYAEYSVVNEKSLISSIPESMSFAEASVLTDGFLTSMNFLKDVAQIRKGQKLLVIGASGSLGTAAVQLGLALDVRVTAVAGSANQEFLKELRVHRVIDYKQENYLLSETKWDVIYDAVGVSCFRDCRSILTQKGLYMSPVLNLSLLGSMIGTSKSKGQRAVFEATGMKTVSRLSPMLDEILNLYQQEKIRVHIERQFALSEVVEAHRIMDTGHKKGNFVLSPL